MLGKEIRNSCFDNDGFYHQTADALRFYTRVNLTTNSLITLSNPLFFLTNFKLVTANVFAFQSENSGTWFSLLVIGGLLLVSQGEPRRNTLTMSNFYSRLC